MNRTIHYSYAIGILIAIIIFLLTSNFGTNESIVQFLTFGLTLSSLCLALIAIIYSIISNATMGNNLAKISEASSNITVMSSDLSKTNEMLFQKIEIIPDILKSVEAKVDSSAQIIEKLGSDEYRLISSEPAVDVKVFDYTKKEIDHFFQISSFNILELMYVFHLAKSKEHSFDLKKLNATLEWDYDYIQGAWVSLKAMGVFNYTELKGVWTIVYFNEYVNKGIEKAIKARAKNWDSDVAKKLEKLDTEFWADKIINVEKYFE